MSSKPLPKSKLGKAQPHSKSQNTMKQAVLDLSSFMSKPSKKTIRRHKRIVGLSPASKAKNAVKKRKAVAKHKEQEKAEYDTQVQHWEDFLSSSDIIDQSAKNPTACFEAYGPAPRRDNVDNSP